MELEKNKGDHRRSAEHRRGNHHSRYHVCG